MAYLDEINKNYSELLYSKEAFKLNDEWGNPEIFEYQKLEKILLQHFDI